MLSGRYQTNKLSSNWSENGDSCCPAPCCESEDETLEHLLLACPAYATMQLYFQTPEEIIMFKYYMY